MRAFLPAVVVAAVFTLAACGGTTTATVPTTTTATSGQASTPADVAGSFKTANQAAPWYSKVQSVKLDGQAVLVRTTLAKGDGATAVQMCEAAYTAAKAANADFVSVTVRSATDSSIAARNELRHDTACSAV